MDCNSIIYDAVHTIEKNKPLQTHKQFEKQVIASVIVKIREYISTISPSNVLYIAFDGVAPFAKMEQQRTRRYKTAFMSLLDLENVKYSGRVAEGIQGNSGERSSEEFEHSPIGKPTTEKWNTSAITPGTHFMKSLSDQIKREFQQCHFETIKTVIVSTSEEPGEGEHKMYEYMRSNVRPDENVVVYGLDSDLIMLSIFHTFLCNKIFLMREPPVQHINASSYPQKLSEIMFLDTHALSLSILKEMGCFEQPSEMRVYDYVFMCFLLGNDFLPHFPSINLRRNGIHQLMEIYSIHISKYPKRAFISKNTINQTLKIEWTWVKLFFSEIAKLEHRFILEEYTFRNKQSARNNLQQPSTKEERLQLAPMEYRGDEHYICPTEEGWEQRYYRITTDTPQVNSSELRSTEFPRIPSATSPEYFTSSELNSGMGRLNNKRTSHNRYNEVELGQTSQPDKSIIPKMCVNYIQGLEWVFRYYTEGCPHWQWKYNYHYPPLFSDLVKYIPPENTSLLHNCQAPNRPFNPSIQLLYVIPKIGHARLLPEVMKEISQKCPEYFIDMQDIKFKWMFCNYLWEAHVCLPEIPLSLLQKWEDEIQKRIG
jgi:5'-3' exoribonuclease 2